MKSIRPAIIIVVEFVYLSVYVTLAFVAARGNSPADSCPLFLAPLLSWFLLIVGLIVSADVGSYRHQVYFLLAMSVHYFVTFFVIVAGFGDTWPRYLAVYWPNHRGMTFIIVTWYVAGQVFQWVNYLRELKLQQIEEKLLI